MNATIPPDGRPSREPLVTVAFPGAAVPWQVTPQEIELVDLLLPVARADSPPLQPEDVLGLFVVNAVDFAPYVRSSKPWAAADASRQRRVGDCLDEFRVNDDDRDRMLKFVDDLAGAAPNVVRCAWLPSLPAGTARRTVREQARAAFERWHEGPARDAHAVFWVKSGYIETLDKRKQIEELEALALTRFGRIVKLYNFAFKHDDGAAVRTALERSVRDRLGRSPSTDELDRVKDEVQFRLTTRSNCTAFFRDRSGRQHLGKRAVRDATETALELRRPTGADGRRVRAPADFAPVSLDASIDGEDGDTIVGSLRDEREMSPLAAVELADGIRAVREERDRLDDPVERIGAAYLAGEYETQAAAAEAAGLTIDEFRGPLEKLEARLGRRLREHRTM